MEAWDLPTLLNNQLPGFRIVLESITNVFQTDCIKQKRSIRC